MNRGMLAPVLVALVCSLLALGCAVKQDHGLHKGQYKKELKGKR